jgi:hypothetical protein
METYGFLFARDYAPDRLFLNRLRTDFPSRINLSICIAQRCLKIKCTIGFDS